MDCIPGALSSELVVLPGWRSTATTPDTNAIDRRLFESPEVDRTMPTWRDTAPSGQKAVKIHGSFIVEEKSRCVIDGLG